MQTVFINKAPFSLLGIFLLSMLVMPASAQTPEDALLFSERSPATGARSIGMAGVGIAGVGDFSALYTNPAGMAYVRQSEFSANLNFLSATTESFVDRGGFGSIEEDLTEQRLGSLAGLYKLPTVRGSLVLGASFHQTQSFDRLLVFEGETNEISITDAFLPFDDEFEVVEEDGGFSPRFFADIPEIAYLGGAIEFLGENVGTGEGLFYQAVNPGSTIGQGSDVLQEGRMNELSFGGAGEAAKGVMFGVSLNFSFGTYDFESIFDEVDVNGENTPDLYIVLNGDNELSGFDQMIYTERFTSDLLGANLRTGISAVAMENLRIGVTVETPTFYRVEEAFETIVETQFDSGGSLIYGGQPGDLGKGNFEYEIHTPWRFGAGLSYDIGALRLMGDVEFIDWTQLELEADFDRDFFRDINRVIQSDFQAVVNTRFGAEYRLDQLTVRGGIAMQPDPIDASLQTSSGTVLDRDKLYTSLGASFHFSESFRLDAGWMQERQDDVYQPDFVDYLVDEQRIRNQFLFGFAVLF